MTRPRWRARPSRLRAHLEFRWAFMFFSRGDHVPASRVCYRQCRYGSVLPTITKLQPSLNVYAGSGGAQLSLRNNKFCHPERHLDGWPTLTRTLFARVGWENDLYRGTVFIRVVPSALYRGTASAVPYR